MTAIPLNTNNPSLIMLSYRGSVSHGTYRPNTEPNSIDDIDLIGVTMPSLHDMLTRWKGGLDKTQEIKQNEWDIVLYSLPKMVHMLTNGNPNVLSCLWIAREHVIQSSKYWEMIVRQRHLFATQTSHASFVGYAYSQLKRMERFEHYGYMGDKRKKLVEQHGYDTKNASHLIRLLRMAAEFLSEGTMHVDRSGIDADELVAIKRGEFTLDQIKQMADNGFKAADTALAASKLPEYPNRPAINDLLYNTMMLYYRESQET